MAFAPANSRTCGRGTLKVLRLQHLSEEGDPGPSDEIRRQQTLVK